MQNFDSTDFLFLCLTLGTLAFSAVAANFYLFRMLMDAKRTEEAVMKWPSVTGTVKISEVKVHHSIDTVSEYPHVAYSYEVMGKPYRSDQIIPGGDVGGSGSSSVVQRYPVGAQVTVYYDPHEPKKAVLERGAKFSNTTWLFIIVTNIFLCVIMPVAFIWNSF